MRVADQIVADLWDRGVEYVFGVVGGNSIHLTDVMAKQREENRDAIIGTVARHGKMRFVPMHGERDAGYAAIGYAKQRGGLGAAMVTTGCASTNIVTAVLSAWQDSVPLIVVAGQVPTNRLGGGGRQSGTQGANMEPIVRTITKGVEEWVVPNRYSSRLMGLALTPRRGPVWISVPLDIQSASLEPESATLER